jgi:hypothetical protein
VNGRPVLVGDGIKIAKAGRKMPAVKKLHQPGLFTSFVSVAAILACFVA